VWVVLTTILTGHEFLRLFSLGLAQRSLYNTNLHTVQDMQGETDAVAEEFTVGTLHDIFDKFVVHLLNT
jgi:hypothetical protein